MERRKATPLHEYIVSISEPPELVHRRVQFYNNLRHFYRKRWGCPMKVPFIQGVEVDLFRLYEAVVGLGGWQKVSNTERWAEVLHEINFDDEIQMAEYGIKMIYMRYLSKFEQAEFGNENDEHENELLGSRGRLKNFALVAHAESPISMSRAGSNESIAPDYRKIVFSLLSGLPNEVDFSINVCTLLSHPGPYLFRLAECPQILTLFAAHCGVFDDGDNSLVELHTKAWRLASGHDFGAFWRRAGIRDDAILQLLTPIFKADEAVDELQRTANTEGFYAEKFATMASKYDRLFADVGNGAGDAYDFRDVVKWRVFQVLSIARNLSFEECNRAPITANVPFLKFLIACCYSKHQVLVNNAFDTLSNIANEVDLNASGSVFEDFLLLKTVSRGLFANDKFEVLRALEILAGLCSAKNNESTLCEFVDELVLGRIFTLVTVKDILLCIFTLEALYQLSEMGRSVCEMISRFDHGVDLLVDLATSDAASFAGTGLAGIKVVEIHGVTGQLQPYQPPRASTTTSAAGSSSLMGKQMLAHNNSNATVSGLPLAGTTPGRGAVQQQQATVQKMVVNHSQSHFQQATLNNNVNTIAYNPSGAYTHIQTFAPASPTPAATSRTIIPSVGSYAIATPSTTTSTINTAGTVTSQIFQYIPATTPAPTELTIRTEVISTSAKPATGASNSASQTTPQPSRSFTRVGTTAVSQLDLTTTPTSGRGKRTASSCLRGASIRKADAKNASMRAVQEVIAAMSTSVNRKGIENNDGGENVAEGVTQVASTAAAANIPTAVRSSPSPTSSIAGAETRLEQLTKAWINARCTLVDGAVANRGEMYAAYVEHIQSTKNTSGGTQMLAGSMQMFINQLKAIFPSIVITHSPGSTIHAVEGIRFTKGEILTETSATQKIDASPSLLMPAAGQTKLFVNGYLLDEVEDVPSSFQNGVIPMPSTDKLTKANGNLDGAQGQPAVTHSTKVDGADGISISITAGADDDRQYKLSKTKMSRHEVNGNALGNSAAGDNNATLTYLADEEKQQVQSTQSVTETPQQRLPHASEGTLGAFLKTAAASNGVGGRGKRRTAANGHSRGFAKRSKIVPAAETPPPPSANNATTSTETSGALSIAQPANGTLVVVGQSMAMAADSTIAFDASAPSTSAPLPAAVMEAQSLAPVQLQPQPLAEFVCEWDCCGRLFTSADAMLFHSTADHLKDIVCGGDTTSKAGGAQQQQQRAVPLSTKFICRWPDCDTTPRSKWSITTHLQDHHCTESALQLALRKRLEMGTDNYLAWIRQRIAKLPPMVGGADNSDGYTQIAAVDAIKRHAPNAMPNEITDDSEGPVTKSLRLTSCLILRNLARHSVEGRRKIRRYESHLAWLALSKMESNVALAQALSELCAHSSTSGATAAASAGEAAPRRRKLAASKTTAPSYVGMTTGLGTASESDDSSSHPPSSPPTTPTTTNPMTT